MRSTSVTLKALAATALVAAAIGTSAHAADVSWNVTIGLPMPVLVQTQPQVVVYPQPQVVYQQPQVVYQQPQVVYQQPPVVYTQPQVVYTQPRVVYRQPLVVVAPRPVVVAAPPGYYRHGHRGEHGQRGRPVVHTGYGQVAFYR